MRVLNSQVNLNGYIKKIKKAKKRALLLNYDGTLAPFCNNPGIAVPYPGIREMLNILMADDRTRVVLVSGRPAKDLISLLGLKNCPEIWGCYGFERFLPDKTYQVCDIDGTTRLALEQANDWVAHIGLASWCENKIGALTIHLRGLPTKTISYARKRVKSMWLPIAKEFDLDFQEFDEVMELRSKNMRKSVAVRTLLDELSAETVVTYLGDGLTDEEAFSTINERGTSILVREEYRQTNADLWLKPPSELIQFLSNFSTLTHSV